MRERGHSLFFDIISGDWRRPQRSGRYMSRLNLQESRHFFGCYGFHPFHGHGFSAVTVIKGGGWDMLNKLRVNLQIVGS